MTELLKPVIGEVAIKGRVGGVNQHPTKIDKKPPQRELSPPPESLTKVGRNDPCPCGSGKKYKRCHGQ